MVNAVSFLVGAAACGGEADAPRAPLAAAGSSDAAGNTAAGAASNVAGASDSAGTSNAAGALGLGGAPTSSAGASAAGASAGGASSAGASAAGATGVGGAPTGSAGSGNSGTGAPETTPVGYGKPTTGGGSVAAKAVETLAEIQAAIDAYSGTSGLVLQYTGKFDFGSIKDPCVQHTLPAQSVEIKGKSNITIQGADGSAANFGIHVAGASSNVIIRNLTLGLTPGGDASDLISIEGTSSGVPTKIWIDHNELFTSMADCPGTGDTAFDGMIDVKKGADLITVSYNYLHDHHKVSLNGYSDSDDVVRHITFHHNLFENIGSRAPLQRHGYSHLFDNYFLKVTTSGVNVRTGGYSLIEANYFENVKNPVTSRDSSAIGFWELKNNNLASAKDVATGNPFGISWDNGSSGTVNATAWKTTATFPEALGYSYEAQPFQCVHDGLRAVVGAGKGLATLKCK